MTKAMLIPLFIGVLALPLGARGGEVAPQAKNQAGTDADNTARNVRDRNDAAVNPMDQGGSESDRKITQHIRQTLVDNDSLSMNAHNVKIVTLDGVVTLRGPVKSTDEKLTIASVASKAPGVKRVDNQIEVEAHP